MIASSPSINSVTFPGLVWAMMSVTAVAFELRAASTASPTVNSAMRERVSDGAMSPRATLRVFRGRAVRDDALLDERVRDDVDERALVAPAFAVPVFATAAEADGVAVEGGRLPLGAMVIVRVRYLGPAHPPAS